MERSGDYIDYKAYVRYLRKVTEEPDDSKPVRKDICEKIAIFAAQFRKQR
jgi:hypothetical protein